MATDGKRQCHLWSTSSGWQAFFIPTDVEGEARRRLDDLLCGFANDNSSEFNRVVRLIRHRNLSAISASGADVAGSLRTV